MQSWVKMMDLDDNRPEPIEPQGSTGQDQAAQPARAAQPPVTIPDDALIVVPVRNLVLFPGMILPVTVGRDNSIAASQQAIKSARPIGLLLQRQPDVDAPRPNDLYEVGTLAQILRYITTPDGT